MLQLSSSNPSACWNVDIMNLSMAAFSAETEGHPVIVCDV